MWSQPRAEWPGDLPGWEPPYRWASGANPKALGWMPDGRLAFASDTGQPFSSLTMAYAISDEGEQPPVPLPYGPVRDVSYGPGGGVVIGRNTGDPAFWKRYRGGTAGAIWIDREGNGDFQPLLRPEAIGGNLASPMWVGDRIFFLSDHEGIGNLYSCSLEGMTSPGTPTTTTITPAWRRATATGSSTRWRLSSGCTSRLRTGAQEVPVELGSPRTQRQPRFVPADRYLSGYQLDRSGKRVVLNTRGKLFSFAPFDGPVYNMAHLRVSGTGSAAFSVQGPTSSLSATPAVSRRSRFSAPRENRAMVANA